jgi:hypothetical protein
LTNRKPAVFNISNDDTLSKEIEELIILPHLCRRFAVQSPYSLPERRDRENRAEQRRDKNLKYNITAVRVNITISQPWEQAVYNENKYSRQYTIPQLPH